MTRGRWAALGLSLALLAPSVPLHAQPSLAPSAVPQEASPAVVDTAVADLRWPSGWVEPRTFLVGPDTLRLGDELLVAVDVPDTVSTPPDSLLTGGQDWLVAGGWRPAATPGTGQGPQAGWPAVASGSRRLVRGMRIYRLDPFVLQVPGWTSRVMAVLPRLADANTLAPVRNPRPLGWSPAVWLLWTVFVLALAALAWLGLRRRRRLADSPPDAPLPSPAWMEAACGLQELWRAGLLEGGRNREFLDGLAGIMRSFTAGRYLIGAREMTATEIVDACGRRAYEPAPVRELAGVIAAADGSRYHPADPGGADCRRAAGTFFRVLEQVRIRPEFTIPPADLVLRADRALSELRGDLAADADQEVG